MFKCIESHIVAHEADTFDACARGFFDKINAFYAPPYNTKPVTFTQPFIYEHKDNKYFMGVWVRSQFENDE